MAAVQILHPTGCLVPLTKGITTRHWELNVVWKCNIYIHSFFSVFLKCYSAFLFVFMFLFVTELWWIRTFFFVSKYVRRHKVQILCEVFTFSPAFKFFTKVWNFKEKRKKKKACSTSDSLTTSLLDHFFFLRVFLYHRQPPEHIGVELGYVDTVWSFMCSPVQTPTSHDHMFYVCSPLHTLFYSYWTEIYYSSNTSTKKSPFGLYEKIIYWTCRPIIYNDTGSFYYFLHGYIRRRRHWVSFSFLLFFFYTS